MFPTSWFPHNQNRVNRFPQLTKTEILNHISTNLPPSPSAQSMTVAMEGINKSSAASRFARTAVILRALGEQIRSPKLLRGLCLTNKLFHSEFIVYIYRELDTPIENIDIANPHLVHTRMLVARPTPGNQYVAQYDAFNEVVQQLLSKMPVLETFVWPDTVDLMPATLDVLQQSCRRLKGLHIYQAETVSRRPWRLDLSGFKNLQYLTLHTCCHEVSAWMSNIIQLLLASPGLKSLDFSIPAAIIIQALQSRQTAGVIFLFDRLCDDYAASGGKPLHLRSLRCGHSVYPTNRSSLVKLTDLKYLEEIDFINGPALWAQLHPQAGFLPTTHYRTPIEYRSFMPQHCPNLRRFSATHYEDGIQDYLCAVAQKPDHSKRLAIYVEELEGWGHGDPSLLLRNDGITQGLPIRLRMLGLDLESDSVYRSSRSFLTGFSAKEILDNLVSSNADSLEGLKVNLAERPGGVLLLDIPLGDMKGYGVELCELHALKSAVRRLPHLGQLAVNTVSATSWRNKDLVDPGFVFKTAHMLATAGSALAYINIFHWFWRVNRQHDGVVELEELGKAEWKSVELFHLVTGSQYFSDRLYAPDNRMFWPHLYQNFA